MMTPSDYAADLRDCLLRRQSWHGSEIEGLAQRLPREWRCMVGLHYPKWYPDCGRSWDEPGEPGFECAVCVEPAYPLRLRLVFAFERTWLGEWYFYTLRPGLDTLIAKARGRYCQKHQNPYDYPCSECEWERAHA